MIFFFLILVFMFVRFATKPLSYNQLYYQKNKSKLKERKNQKKITLSITMEDVATRLRQACSELKDSPGTFAVGGNSCLPLPGLFVTNFGYVPLPLPSSSAQREIYDLFLKELKALCTRSRFGRGKKEVLDESYRAAWELDPDQFRFVNPVWESSISQLVNSQILKALGCQDTPTKVHLFKLLLYEEGGLFKPHKDTEKGDGMFATLVVILPSEYEGGQLSVQFGGKTKLLGQSNPYQFQFASFYCDCLHELKPVTKGYRICLVYNLCASSPQQQLSLPSGAKNASAVKKVKDVLCDWGKDPDDFRFAALELDHRYSLSSLQISSLKGFDRKLFQGICQAARELEVEGSYRANLGLVLQRVNEKGMGWRTRRTEEIETHETEKDFELCDGVYSSESVFEDDLDSPQFEIFSQDPEDCLSLEDYYDEDSDWHEVEAAMGNYPASYEKTYHLCYLLVSRPTRCGKEEEGGGEEEGDGKNKEKTKKSKRGSGSSAGNKKRKIEPEVIVLD